jgi:hypothetical protein
MQRRQLPKRTNDFVGGVIKDAGHIKRVGSNRSGYWLVK